MEHDSRDIERLLERYFRHEATADETRALEEWVLASDANRDTFLRRRAAAQTTEQAFTPADVDTEGALREVLSFGSIGRERRRRMWSRVGSVAAAVLLPLCIVLAVLLYRAQPSSSDSPLLAVTAPFGSMVRTTLPDGTEVWLNVNSTITYPSAFDSDRRTVSLSGEAFFAVEADAEHPFVVDAGGADIVATGTQFNVNAYGVPSVTLVEGRVDVLLRSLREDVSLRPGDHMSMRGDSIIIAHDSNLRKWCSWREGVLIFDNDPMADVFERLEQIYNVSFTVHDSAIAQSRCHATFVGENINDILELLELSAPLRFVCTSADDEPRPHFDVLAAR